MPPVRSNHALAFARLLTGMGVVGVERTLRNITVFSPGWAIQVNGKRLSYNRNVMGRLKELRAQYPVVRIATVQRMEDEIEMARVSVLAEDFAYLLACEQRALAVDGKVKTDARRA